jgi:hypothetical protein
MTTGEAIVAAMTFCGLFLGAHEYFEAKKDRTVLRSMGFGEALRTSEAIADLMLLDKTFVRNSPGIFARMGQIIDPTEANVFYEDQMVTMIRAPGAAPAGTTQVALANVSPVESAAVRMTLLLDSFAICVEKGLCDCETGVDFFGSTLLSTWPVVGPYVKAEMRNEAAPEFGTAFERMSKDIRRGESCE